MMNKRNLGIASLITLAVVVGGLIYRDTRESKIANTNTNADILKDYGIDMTGDGKVEIVPVNEQKLPPAPSLVRSTDFANTLAPEVKKNVIIRLEDTIVAIKKDPKGVTNWIDLGAYRKTLGDYQGARDAWEYAKALDPNNIVPWNNLGDLYHFYLKDYKKSEENWKRTIALRPDYAQGYRGLYELYKYSFTERSGEIPALLKQGIEKAPTATDLKVLLADYEKSVVPQKI